MFGVDQAVIRLLKVAVIDPNVMTTLNPDVIPVMRVKSRIGDIWINREQIPKLQVADDDVMLVKDVE